MIRHGIEKIANGVAEQLQGHDPKLVFHFDCAGRGKVLFRDQEKTSMLKSLQERIGTGLPWLGFYTYGEIGRFKGKNRFHNYTLVLLALY